MLNKTEQKELLKLASGGILLFGIIGLGSAIYRKQYGRNKLPSDERKLQQYDHATKRMFTQSCLALALGGITMVISKKGVL